MVSEVFLKLCVEDCTFEFLWRNWTAVVLVHCNFVMYSAPFNEVKVYIVCIVVIPSYWLSCLSYRFIGMLL